MYNADGDLEHVNQSCLKIFGISDPGQVENFKLFEDPNLSEVEKKIFAGAIK